MSIAVAVAIAVSVIWLYLLLGRGHFWRAAQRDEPQPSGILSSEWPDVVAVVPARKETNIIGSTVASLAAQDYPGSFTTIIVDDESRDGTAAEAAAAARVAGAENRFAVVHGRPSPPGWTGKLWAVRQGIAAAREHSSRLRYLWLCDADIRFAPDMLTSLVRRADAGGFVLVSLMAKLRCSSFAERCLVPAFIFFFQMLYPFAWVNRPERSTAAAAGGCMLVRCDALAESGDIDAIRGALIDDCALAARLKSKGAVWLGLTERALSVRPYEHLDDIRRMVARSAYAQLHYSPLLLGATVAGMILVFVAPPLLAIFASGLARWLGAADWAAMAGAYLPILRFYRVPAAWSAALPAIAAMYLAFTLDSAYQHARGRGGLWKGRAQAISSRGK